MFEVHNKIFVTSNEQSQHLQEGFAHAGEHMKSVPGFHEFHMLKSSKSDHFIVRVIWESESYFQDWAKSEHFREAHKGQGDSSLKSEIQGYDIIL